MVSDKRLKTLSFLIGIPVEIICCKPNKAYRILVLPTALLPKITLDLVDLFTLDRI